MNKQQRDYAITRIKNINKSKQIACECGRPALYGNICRAIAAGTAKLKPSKGIIALFESKIMDGHDRYEMKAELADLFETPQSYADAMAELKAEQDKHAAENKLTSDFAQSLIDRIELGEFEDGKEPIRLMEAYAPKAPKATKAR